MIQIDRLIDLGPAELKALVVESEADGLRLVRRLADEWMTGANRFDRPGEALFAARQDSVLVGVCGLNVDPYAGRPEIGRVRHLYVLQSHRRLGVGERLVTAVITAARERFDVLRLSTSNPAAARLYERLGLRRETDSSQCTHLMPLV